MNSPGSKSYGSPKKSRPATAHSPKKSSIVYKTQISQINIVTELNQREIVSQEKDIEIERLQTTIEHFK